LSSCSGPFKRSFQVNVINTSGEKVPAVVLLDGERYLLNGEEEAITPATIELEFSRSNAELSGFAMRKLGVRAVSLDEDGKLMSDGEGASPYKDRDRVIFFNDAGTVLFIVEPNPEFQ
jgi:hypothetical protein